MALPADRASALSAFFMKKRIRTNVSSFTPIFTPLQGGLAYPSPIPNVFTHLDSREQTTYHSSHMTAYGNYHHQTEQTAYEEAVHRHVEEKKEKRQQQLAEVRRRRRLMYELMRKMQSP